MAPRHNRALWEVLREGPTSPYARWFDIDWEAQGGQVLLPVLGGPLGDGDRTQLRRSTADVLRYYDHAFPLREGTEELPLPQLLDAQWYRPAWWRLARTELNYRRFFSISELIGVRVEDPEVFDATHGKILQLLREGVLDGLRVDHPDGLADPDGYLRAAARGDRRAAGRSWRRSSRTASGCPPPGRSPGTTGYDALRHVDGLFTDPAGAGELLGQYRRFAAPQTDRGGDWAATVRRAAYEVLTHELAAEVDRLTRAATARAPRPRTRRCATARPGRCAPRCAELLVRMQVYRPYASGDAAAVVTEEAAAEARRAFACPRRPGAVDVVRDLVLGRARRRAGARGVPGPVRADRVRAAGQVRGGHGVLPVRAAAVGERGGRRPGQPGGVPGGLPRVLRARAARLARHRDGRCRRTTPSAAPTSGRRSPCSPSARERWADAPGAR